MDGVKCKPGNLAIKTSGKDNIGLLVEVVEHNTFASAVLHRHVWNVKLMGNAYDPYNEVTKPAGAIAHVSDCYLTPLRGDPLEESFPPLKEPLHA